MIDSWEYWTVEAHQVGLTELALDTLMRLNDGTAADIPEEQWNTVLESLLERELVELAVLRSLNSAEGPRGTLSSSGGMVEDQPPGAPYFLTVQGRDLLSQVGTFRRRVRETVEPSILDTELVGPGRVRAALELGIAAIIAGVVGGIIVGIVMAFLA